MPYLSENQRPRMPERPAPKPVPKPSPSSQKDIFGGKASGSRHEVSDKLAKELKAELKLSGPDVKAKIKELQGRILPESTGSTVYRSTSERAMVDEQWAAKHAAEKAPRDYEAQAKRRKEGEILKKILKNK